LAQFAWTLDFLSKLIFNKHIFKVTAYVFENPFGIYVLIPILIHMFGTNLALLLTYKEKINSKVILYSLVYIIILYGVSLSYPPPDRNVNCVYEICGLTQYTFANYTFFWPALIFFLIVIPTHGIQYMLYSFSRKSKKFK